MSTSNQKKRLESSRRRVNNSSGPSLILSHHSITIIKERVNQRACKSGVACELHILKQHCAKYFNYMVVILNFTFICFSPGKHFIRSKTVANIPVNQYVPAAEMKQAYSHTTPVIRTTTAEDVDLHCVHSVSGK